MEGLEQKGEQGQSQQMDHDGQAMERVGAKGKQSNIRQLRCCNEMSRMAHIGSLSSQKHDVRQGGCKNSNSGRCFCSNVCCPFTWRGDLGVDPSDRLPRSAHLDGYGPTCPPCTWRSRLSCDCTFV